ncbi:VanZ family protein [Clostridium grantii]|uniref:Glycopeptide antibiotics resistance protein n=1 Tax=Clostridium grantii DSM 8605 TaxID=1121316 RepID=A0A1M5VKN0_9CLOT|nr:VanZ family protein [Clostridium grantii]SHH75775.1 Glycopeptide antibiotics resistance protein [Clostridium grantii DSM 8605]
MITIYNENKTLKSLAILTLPIYIIGVLYFTLLWRTGSFNGEYNLHLNLIPFFWFIEPVFLGKDFYLSQIVLNIIMFVPLGVILPLIFRSCNEKRVLWIAFMVTLSIEFLQPIFGRCTDIDDVMLNVLGAFIGYISLCVMTEKLNSMKDKVASAYYLLMTKYFLSAV